MNEPARTRLRPVGTRSEAGLTLIEVLVVVVVLGLLAGIAIPVLASRREAAWTAQLQSDLRNAAGIQALVHGTDGTFTADPERLREAGWRSSPGVSLTGGSTASAEALCLEATHERLPDDHPWKTAHYSSEAGTFGTGVCPGGGGGVGGTGGGGDGDGEGDEGDGGEGDGDG